MVRLFYQKGKKMETKLNSVILARGGSKGVPGKNIKKLNGIPLLA